MPKQKPLSEQVIVITGASSGIGRVTARRAAGKGARVLLVARNEADLRDVRAEIEGAGGVAEVAVADVGIAAEVEAAAARAIELWGRIDTWVSNAGTAIYGRIVDTSLDEHEQLFRTNYFGTVHSALVAYRHMKETGGTLIAVGSIASDIPSPILSAYSASKHAVKGLIDSLRMEFEADAVPITVTLIKPAGIDTPIAERAANHLDGEARIPPPVYDPELVATAILDAAVNRRRDITVGGAGRLQVLVGTHVPALLDLLSAPLARGMRDPAKKPTRTSSVFAPRQRGRERSGVQPGRRTSVYTAAVRHPVVTGAAIAGTIAGLALLAGTRRRKPD